MMRWKFSKIIFSRNYCVSSNFHRQLYHKNLYNSNLLKACPWLRSYSETFLPQNFQCRSWSSDNFGKLNGEHPQQIKGHKQPSEVVDIDKELLRYDYEDVETYVEEDSASDDETFLTEIKRMYFLTVECCTTVQVLINVYIYFTNFSLLAL